MYKSKNKIDETANIREKYWNQKISQKKKQKTEHKWSDNQRQHLNYNCRLTELSKS